MRPRTTPVSWPWLVHARLNLDFLQPIAMAISFSPARRPAAPVLRQHPEYWCSSRSRISRYLSTHKVFGWVDTPETLTDRTSVTEPTRMYSQRVSGVSTHPKASKKNPLVSKVPAQQLLDIACKPERLRVAHPCAQSRSTVHPVHE